MSTKQRVEFASHGNILVFVDQEAGVNMMRLVGIIGIYARNSPIHS